MSCKTAAETGGSEGQLRFLIRSHFCRDDVRTGQPAVSPLCFYKICLVVLPLLFPKRKLLNREINMLFMGEKCSIINEEIAAPCSSNIVTLLLFAPPFHEPHQTCWSVLLSCHITSSSVAALSSETTFALLRLCCIIYVQNSRRNPAAWTCPIGYQLRLAGMCLRSPSHAMVIYCVQIRLSIEMSLKKGTWKAHGSLIIHIEEPTEGLWQLKQKCKWSIKKDPYPYNFTALFIEQILSRLVV